MENYKVLVSGSYNVFNEGWDGVGVYIASGLYASESFKLPIYIGSSRNLQERIEWRHISKLNRNKHENPVFQASWNKYGQNNFIWFLVQGCEKLQTISLEQKYLDLYRPFVDEFGGFNISHLATNPSIVGQKHSEETKLKMSRIRKEKFANGELICANKGKKYSDERKRWMSEVRIGKSKFLSQKPVICVESGKIYNSIKGAAKENNLRPSGISSACLGINKTCGGFKWEFINDIDKKRKHPPKQLKPEAKGE